MWYYYLVLMDIREKLKNTLRSWIDKEKCFSFLRSLNQDLDSVIRVRVFIVLYFDGILFTNPIKMCFLSILVLPGPLSPMKYNAIRREVLDKGYSWLFLFA